MPDARSQPALCGQDFYEAGENLRRETGGSYGPVMGTTFLRRLMLVLTALAFMLGTAPETALAVPSSAATGSLTAAGSSAQPYAPCPGKTPSGLAESRMMPCGSVACAGAIIDAAFPLLLDRRFHAEFEYPAQAYLGLAGLLLPPDPFPPRMAILV